MEENSLPPHIQELLKKVPQASSDLGVAIPETVQKLTELHELLCGNQFIPYHTDWSWLVLVANRLVVENMKLRQRADSLTTEIVNSSLKFCGYKYNFRF